MSVQIEDENKFCAELFQTGMLKAPTFYHGTTYHAVHDIIVHGIKASTDASRHEFTVPGVYVANCLYGALPYHATATRFASEDDPPEDLPWVRFVFVVETTSAPLRNSSYAFE